MKVEQRNKLARFNNDEQKRTRYTEITLATWNEVERYLQVLGVRRWRELVTDRDKWRGIVRQAKAQNGPWRQRKKNLHLVGYFHNYITIHGFMNVKFLENYFELEAA
jgi:hypothetical protein